MSDENLDNIKLSDLFDLGWRNQRELEKSNNEQCTDFILKRKKTIEILKKCEFMLDELHLFSDNETFEEVSTSEIRYFLLYALLGWLYSKISSTKPDLRLIDLDQAKLYYIKYLQLTKNYELHNFKMEKQRESNSLNDEPSKIAVLDKQSQFDSNLISAAYERNEKIRRFKEQKELEKKLESMSVIFEAKLDHIDDEHRRNCYMTFVKSWINRAVDDLKVINDEINILRSMDLSPSGRASNLAGSEKKKAPEAMKPMIITKDMIQAKVFGAGYPSLPVYSIEEFYDQLAEKGMMPQATGHMDTHDEPVKIGGGVTDKQKEDDKAEKDRLADLHDEEELRKQREWDEFKDENKRGSGNRYNRS